MATPKERSDERERARAARESEKEAAPTAPDPGARAEQQGDGQPENARELEDRSSGASQSAADPDD
jgi:hypothetical protein